LSFLQFFNANLKLFNSSLLSGRLILGMQQEIISRKAVTFLNALILLNECHLLLLWEEILSETPRFRNEVRLTHNVLEVVIVILLSVD
jgi:hypothetical protein